MAPGRGAATELIVEGMFASDEFARVFAGFGPIAGSIYRKTIYCDAIEAAFARRVMVSPGS